MATRSSYNRRKFIAASVKGSIAVGVGMSAAGSLFASPEPPGTTSPWAIGFDQQPLPYAYDALENIIDAKTMEIHYSKHAATYSKTLKDAAAAEKVNDTETVESILANISKYSAKMRNNAGGHYNHELFWQCMRPKQEDNKPTGSLLKKIEGSFGSFDTFKTQFGDAAKNRFGSGWAWLYIDSGNALKIGSSPNQDNPFMNISDIKGIPLLGLDVWEHAYYLKYQNRRAEYVDNWWKVVNWDFVQQRFDKLG